jgi:putative ATP-binding cassette transporter
MSTSRPANAGWCAVLRACGKSTLLRAIAGLWPFGSGRITVPDNARIMFMPQKSYLPEWPAEGYPGLSRRRRQRGRCRYAQALVDCRLPHLVERLDESARWSHQLSPGEQQRLAFAQALLYRPDILFMDEASSALDNATEAHLMYGCSSSGCRAARWSAWRTGPRSRSTTTTS